MIKNQSTSMDKILDGYTKGELGAYFGEPRLNFPSLCVFDMDGGVVAVIFRNMKSAAYVLYGTDGKLIRAVNVKPLEGKIANAENISMTDFVEANGVPQIDLGSGRSLPAYLSTDAKIYRLNVIGGTIKKISSTSLLPTG